MAMGLENSWNSEDLTENRSPEFVIPSVESNVNPYIDTSVDNGPFSDLDCLFSSVEQNPSSHQDLYLLADEEGEAGVCGLRNLGNTCFVSAGVQCLVVTPPLVQTLLSPSFCLGNKPSGGASLTLELIKLAKNIWSGTYSCIHPLDFKTSLSAKFPQFNDYRQHDCQEFLALLLDALHEQMNAAGNKDSSFQTECRELNDTSLQKEASTSKAWSSDEVSLVKADYVYNNKLIRNPVGDVAFKDNNLEKECSGESTLCNKGNSSNRLNNSITTSGSSLAPGGPSSSKAAGLSLLNNAVGRLSGLGDIIKEDRTSNVNVLVTHQEANNEIRFNSEKYSWIEKRVPKKGFYNVNSLHHNPVHCGKRGKGWNNNCNNYEGGKIKEGVGTRELDLKRIKLGEDMDEDCGVNQITPAEWKISNVDMQSNSETRGVIEKNRLAEMERNQHMHLEKNCRMEYERKLAASEQELPEDNSRSVEDRALYLKGETRAESMSCTQDMEEEERVEEWDLETEEEEDLAKEGEKHWKNHLSSNSSVIVDTFQGQFKSTVVCSICKFVSVTYEPFMYLSLPLPTTHKKIIKITYVGKPLGEGEPLELEVERNHTIGQVIYRVLEQLGEKSDKLTSSRELPEDGSQVVMAQVLDHHIAKLLDENTLMQDLNHPGRSLYAFRVFSLDCEAEPTSDEMDMGSKGLERSSAGVSSITAEGGFLGEIRCTICLEEMDSGMKCHLAPCACLLCEGCILASCAHHGNNEMECPICRKVVNPDKEFEAVDLALYTPARRMMFVPLMLRMDRLGDGNNNQKATRIFGDPGLLKLPTRVSPNRLRFALDQLLFKHTSGREEVQGEDQQYRLLLVDPKGTHCSRCLYAWHCTGCEVKGSETLILRSSDSLGIAFSVPIFPLNEEGKFKASSLSQPYSQQPLSLYDCIKAFSQSETLDEQNPWYCPRCRRNQCATKTLSIWRYPDYLIVYLKRFIFYDQISTKLEDKVVFPLQGLKMSPNVPPYDLYACVCHSGGISSGHYTTYTQHPVSGEWHYFNDSYVTRHSPQEGDFTSAYILFYRKHGLTMPNLEVVQNNNVLQNNA